MTDFITDSNGMTRSVTQSVNRSPIAILQDEIKRQNKLQASSKDFSEAVWRQDNAEHLEYAIRVIERGKMDDVAQRIGQTTKLI